MTLYDQILSRKYLGDERGLCIFFLFFFFLKNLEIYFLLDKDGNSCYAYRMKDEGEFYLLGKFRVI